MSTYGVILDFSSEASRMLYFSYALWARNLNYLNYIVFPLIGLDSLDFCEPASKDVLFLVSVSIRVIRGRLYLLAAEQCWRSGRVVYVVFQKLTPYSPKRSNSTVKWRISGASFVIAKPRVIVSRRSYTFFNAAAITFM